MSDAMSTVQSPMRRGRRRADAPDSSKAAIVEMGTTHDAPPDAGHLSSEAHETAASVKIPAAQLACEAQTTRGGSSGSHTSRDTHYSDAPASNPAAHTRRVTRRTHGGKGGSQSATETHGSRASADLLATIADLYRVRRSLLMAEGDMSRRIKGKQRSAATYRLRANGIEPEPGKLPTPTEADEAVVLKVYPAFFAALETLKAQRMQEEKALVAEAEKLPIMAWASTVRGLGAKSVVALVAEAGDPGRYDTPSKLWKRYGLAVINGERQRRVKDAEESLRHGYNAERRAALYVIGTNLIRSGNEHARSIYEAVKARELAKDDITKGHAHNRALRIVQKRLALAFWLAWRQVERGEPISDVPAAFTTPAAEVPA